MVFSHKDSSQLRIIINVKICILLKIIILYLLNVNTSINVNFDHSRGLTYIEGRLYRACMLGLILLGAGLDYGEQLHRVVKNFGR